ncbi:MAG: adenosylmethionine decarboxylase [Thalassobaculaceae bacterium]
MAKSVALRELGMNSATMPVASDGPQSAETSGLDHFVQRDGLCFAGTHLIIDLWGARRLDDIAFIEATLRHAVQTCGATLLHIHLHHFTPNGGVSGVAVLAESHISIHTWPERQYAALDVFMCGDAEPHRAIAVLREAFEPSAVQINDHKRGIL